MTAQHLLTGRTNMFRMWILKGDGKHASAVTFRIKSGGIKTVGRTTRADFVVDAALVSRLHCRLEADDERLNVVDLDSTNGTWVNGRRVEKASLADGDRLRVGRVELTISQQAN